MVNGVLIKKISKPYWAKIITNCNGDPKGGGGGGRGGGGRGEDRRSRSKGRDKKV